MAKKVIIIWICFQLLGACAKKVVPSPQPSPQPTKTPTVKFMFVNRIGFRNDSTKHGANDTVFQGICLDLKYFDKKANVSHLDGICYNRNFPENNYPLKDSIIMKEYEVSPGCKYSYEIELGWKQTNNFSTTKNIKYNLKSYPNVDTLKFARDTIIKFIWPDDTASGKFIKTFQWP